MNNSTRHLARLSAAISLAGMVGLGAAIPTFAATETGVTVTAGTLTEGGLTFANFAGITLNGTQQTKDSNWAIANVVDPRGSGAGWNVSLTLSQFAQYSVSGGVYIEGGHTLAGSSLKVTPAPVISKVDATSDATTTITPVTATTALDTGSPVKLLVTNGDNTTPNGKGSYSFADMTSTLTVPAAAYAGTYKSDATVSLNVSP